MIQKLDCLEDEQLALAAYFTVHYIQDCIPCLIQLGLLSMKVTLYHTFPP